MRTLFQRALGFGIAPVIAAIAPLLVLPIAARLDGSAGWAAIGTGQAIGSFCAMVASYGWKVNGGARIALAPDAETQKLLYAHSFWNRLIAFAIIGTICAWLSAALIGGEYGGIAALSALATGAMGLSMAWYSVGTGSSRLVLWYETTPIAAFAILSAAAMLVTGELVYYPVLTICGVIVGLVLLHFALYRRPVPPFSARDVGAAFHSNLALAGVDAIGGSYTTAPVPVAQAFVSTQAAAEVTSVDKVYRIGVTAIVVLGNALQKWVLEVSFADGRMRRHAIALGLHFAVGMTGLLVLVLAGPALTRILLGESVAAPADLFPAYGVTYLLISLTTPLIRNILVPAGRDRTVLVAIVVSACVGLPVMILGGIFLGAPAIVWGLTASEIVVVSVVSVSALTVLRRERAALSEP